MTRRLTLRRDVLGDLTPDELAAVVGGGLTQLGPPTVFDCGDLTGYYRTLPIYWCVTGTTG